HGSDPRFFATCVRLTTAVQKRAVLPRAHDCSLYSGVLARAPRRRPRVRASEAGARQATKGWDVQSGCHSRRSPGNWTYAGVKLRNEAPMLQLIEHHRPELEGLCRSHHVSRLELFGSAVSGEFDDASSDLDFLVEFQPLGPGDRADAYFGLL